MTVQASVQALGYVGVRAKSLEDWASYGSNFLGLQRIDKSRSSMAFRMDDRKQRVIIEADGGQGIGYFGWEVADAAAMEALAAKLGTTREEMACVGDDTPDLPMMRRTALAIAVADAHADVIEAADWVTTQKGGRGAVREVCDLLLHARQAPVSA